MSLAVIANAAYRRQEVQDRVQSCGGIELILSHCQVEPLQEQSKSNAWTCSARKEIAILSNGLGLNKRVFSVDMWVQILVSERQAQDLFLPQSPLNQNFVPHKTLHRGRHHSYSNVPLLSALAKSSTQRCPCVWPSPLRPCMRQSASIQISWQVFALWDDCSCIHCFAVGWWWEPLPAWGSSVGHPQSVWGQSQRPAPDWGAASHWYCRNARDAGSWY